MSEKLSIDQLKQTPEFVALTDNQQKLVEVFLSNGGNRLEAVQIAYPTKNENSARTMSYAFFSNAKVAAALAVANGLDPERSAWESAVDRACNDKKVSQATVSALRLRGISKGWIAADEQVVSRRPKQKMTARVNDSDAVEIATRRASDVYPQY